MRNRQMIGAAALLLASATVAGAQSQPQQGGTIDVGGRFTSTTGDEARYERYRDLRDGANVNLTFDKTTPNWTLDFKAQNVGYRDGRYALGFKSRRVQFSARFEQTPLNYGYYTRTPYNC